ncbi:E3 ubiquitin-protein ligase traip-like [Plakobranchus ocellatus]|uniref:E3 ubiquitin-protein ligase traip-like n=1 Tax=Plakobranchus ocellatus TaxID=259542 RepID=A0AAV4AJS3_9GAST|nr:E3 ubiquitin-protein ligase traip-like [Plakobranchus ocellatus]
MASLQNSRCHRRRRCRTNYRQPGTTRSDQKKKKAMSWYLRQAVNAQRITRRAVRLFKMLPNQSTDIPILIMFYVP